MNNTIKLSPKLNVRNSMVRENVEVTSVNDQAVSHSESSIGIVNLNVRQRELWTKLYAIKYSEERLKVCMTALQEKDIPPEREFWYCYFAATSLIHMVQLNDATPLALRCTEIATFLKSDHLKSRAIFLDA